MAGPRRYIRSFGKSKGYEARTPTGHSHPHGMALPWWRPCRDLAASVGVRHVLSRPAARPRAKIAARPHIATATPRTS
jgi:hypothetical protein